MISIDLTGNERLQFANILPAQGDLESLELVEKILDKVKISDAGNMEVDYPFSFEMSEIEFIQKVIKILDSQKILRFDSLSLIKKIMNIKGDKI